MIEDNLAQYGILGLWTTSLLIQSWKYWSEMKKVIRNNTEAMTRVYTVISKCEKNNKW